MTSLQIGASIRTVDSLQEGVSRFYAEIKRLRQIIQLTDQRRAGWSF
jgi:DNA mismatch repair ATPase MutS